MTNDKQQMTLAQRADTQFMESAVVGHDRRREPRLAVWMRGTVFPPTGAPYRVVVSNISGRGVGLEAAEPIEPGGHYRIALEAGPMRHRSPLRVVSCRRRFDAGATGHETYDVGAEFVMNTWEPPRRPVERVPRNPSTDLTPQVQ